MDTITARTNADAACRAQEAARLRIAGEPWDVIAERCGYAHATNAGRAVRTYLGGLPQADRDDAKRVIRERGEVVWRQALADMDLGRPGAVRAAVATLQRLSAFDGLDEPNRVEIVPTAEQYNAVVQGLVAMRREQLGTAVAVEGDPFSSSEDDVEFVELTEEVEEDGS